MNTIVSPGAVAELKEATDHYYQIRFELGSRFLDEFRRGINQIISRPYAWAPLDRKHRRYRLRHFPYGIVYKINEHANTLHVIALAHLKRRPGYWKGRA